jgi:spoIIIJ-associated protein
MTDAAKLENEGDIAADFLEGLLDIADLDGDIDMDVDGDRAAVEVVGGNLDHLVGRDGEVLDALQELTRLAVYRETGERSRLMLDVAGVRVARPDEPVRAQGRARRRRGRRARQLLGRRGAAPVRRRPRGG